MNRTARTLIATLTVLAIILTATAISAVKHAQELNTQVELLQTELEKLPSTPAGRTPAGSSEMLQKLLAEETAVNAKLRKEIALLKNQLAAPVATDSAVTPAATNTPAFARAAGFPLRLHLVDRRLGDAVHGGFGFRPRGHTHLDQEREPPREYLRESPN